MRIGANVRNADVAVLRSGSMGGARSFKPRSRGRGTSSRRMSPSRSGRPGEVVATYATRATFPALYSCALAVAPIGEARLVEKLGRLQTREARLHRVLGDLGYGVEQAERNVLANT